MWHVPHFVGAVKMASEHSEMSNNILLARAYTYVPQYSSVFRRLASSESQRQVMASYIV
jgi:hypothetical protein